MSRPAKAALSERGYNCADTMAGAPPSPRSGRADSKGPLHREFDRIQQRSLPGRGGEQFERIARHRAIVARALDRILYRAMLLHRRQRRLQIALGDFAALQRALPEFAFDGAAPAEGEHDGQRDLALAKIVADVLAELGRGAAVVERVIDQLER